jgi:hypothetical protein
MNTPTSTRIAVLLYGVELPCELELELDGTTIIYELNPDQPHPSSKQKRDAGSRDNVEDTDPPGMT